MRHFQCMDLLFLDAMEIKCFPLALRGRVINS